MFNVTVINLKDIIKYIIISIIIYFFGKYILTDNFIKNKLQEKIKIIEDSFLFTAIDTESNLIKDTSKSEIVKEMNSEDIMKKILQSEANIFNMNDYKNEAIATKEEFKETKPEEKKIETKEEINEINEIEENDLQIKVVTNNPLKESFNNEYNGIKIKNETNFNLTKEALDSNDLEINKNNIIIFHTHTCESYTMSDNFNNYEETRKL